MSLVLQNQSQNQTVFSCEQEVGDKVRDSPTQ